MGPEEHMLAMARHLKEKYPQLADVSEIDLGYEIQAKFEAMIEEEDRAAEQQNAAECAGE